MIGPPKVSEVKAGDGAGVYVGAGLSYNGRGAGDSVGVRSSLAPGRLLGWLRVYVMQVCLILCP